MSSDKLAQQRLDYYQQRIEKALLKTLPEITTHPTQLHQAMHYSVLGGGKRIRPSLVYATGETLGLDLDLLDAPAVAIELIHAYSLIHDDLPAMDDDNLRRGKATCHLAFDEATAILAGDALQMHAIQVLSTQSQAKLSAEQSLTMVNLLSIAAGSQGMVGGQSLDLSSTGNQLTETELETMHTHKTGALIRASVQMAIICAQQSATTKATHLLHYADCIGLAFQVRDDILDVEGDTAILGKTQGADQALSKSTYPAIMGLTAARQKNIDLYQQAVDSLNDFGDSARYLRYIADFIVIRLK